MIYFMQPTDGGPVKIGTTIDLAARHKALESHYGRPLAILATMDGGRDEEAGIHARFAHLRLGRTEQFRPASDLMEFINRPLFVNQGDVELMPASHGLKNIIVLRGTEEWRNWLHSLAEVNHAPITVTIEQALREMSDRLKHRKPPRRTP